MMTYYEALGFLNGLVNYEKKGGRDPFKLERMARLSALLGDPHLGLKSVHVAGTKGKGSTAAFIHSILKCAGHRVGLYTSPHLLSVRERIVISGSPIGCDELAALTGEVKTALENWGASELPSFFEIYTIIAQLYFRRQGVDIAVYETGLGGRLDATNIIQPLVSVITPISLDHTDILGATLEEVAQEKAGIIKRGAACVMAPQAPEALDRLRRACAERSVPASEVGRDIVYAVGRVSDSSTSFDVRSPRASYGGLETRLIGRHQAMNAATAIGAVEALGACGVKAAESDIRSGIREMKWDGRLQTVGRDPRIVLDGAHNPASARTLAVAVREAFTFDRLHLVIGISKDKDIPGVVAELSALADTVIVTKSSVAGRAADTGAIMSAFGGRDALEAGSVAEAIDRARSSAGPRDLVLVTGSLFIVADALAHLGLGSGAERGS